MQSVRRPRTGHGEEIAQFCKENYGVEFDLMAKVDVNGPKAAPLYKYPDVEETNPEHGGKIKWNFEKFLFDRDGQLVARFKPHGTEAGCAGGLR